MMGPLLVMVGIAAAAPVLADNGVYDLEHSPPPERFDGAEELDLPAQAAQIYSGKESVSLIIGGASEDAKAKVNDLPIQD